MKSQRVSDMSTLSSTYMYVRELALTPIPPLLSCLFTLDEYVKSQA
jgi:hypothetical protein